MRHVARGWEGEGREGERGEKGWGRRLDEGIGGWNVVQVKGGVLFL